MKSITCIMIGMLLLNSFMHISASHRDFDIIIIQGSSLRAGSENNLVSIIINNETSREFQKVKVYLDLQYPFSVSTRDSDQFVVGNIGTMPKNAFFLINVDSGAAYGTHTIPVIIETSVGKYYQELDIKVIGDTLVSVDRISIDGIKGKPVNPGEVFNTDIRLKNVGGNRIQWIRVTLDTNDPGIVPVSSSLTQVFQDLRTGENIVASYDLSVDKNFPPRNHRMSLVLTFQDNLGVTHTQNEIIGLNIRGQPQLELSRRTTDPTRLVQNQPFILTLRMENIGTTNADNVQLKLESPFSGDSEAYLGRMQVEDFANGVFSLNTGNNSGEVVSTLIITYFDGEGKQSVEKEFLIYVNVASEPSFGQVAAGLIFPIFILLIIVGGLFFYRKKRKSKIQDNN